MNTPSNCTYDLRAAGQTYPRTCAECGLGPCKRHPPGAIIPIAKENLAVQEQPAPSDPGQSFLAEGSAERRKRIQRELDAAFTPAQQRAIAVICGQWWESRLEAINVGAVDELRNMVEFLIEANDLERPTAAQIAEWQAQRNRTLAGPRG